MSLEPIVGPTFIIDSKLEKQTRVITRFMQDAELAALVATVVLETSVESTPAAATA